MKKKIILLLIVVLCISASCKKCYICQSYKTGISERIDFEKSCGTEDENKKMELSFKDRYKAVDGYTVRCN